MPATVAVEKMTVVHAASTGTGVGSPDVCKTPAPSGLVPVPYPNIAMSVNLIAPTVTVKCDMMPVAVNSSKLMPSTGDEAGVGGGVVSGIIKGAAEFVAFSFTVKFDGKPAARGMDPMLYNNKNTPPAPLIQPPLPV